MFKTNQKTLFINFLFKKIKFNKLLYTFFEVLKTLKSFI